MNHDQQLRANPFDNVLRAAGRALEEVIAPSLDPANPLAHEQLRLVCRFLDLVRQRAAFVASRQRAELDLALELAERVVEHAGRCPDEVGHGFAPAIAEGERLLGSTAATAEALRSAADRLDALVSCVVRHAATFDAASRDAVEAAVLAASRRTLDLRRAWHSPLGLDPEPATVPRLEDLFQAPPKTYSKEQTP